MKDTSKHYKNGWSVYLDWAFPSGYGRASIRDASGNLFDAVVCTDREWAREAFKDFCRIARNAGNR